jgi:hypothetical protein
LGDWLLHVVRQASSMHMLRQRTRVEHSALFEQARNSLQHTPEKQRVQGLVDIRPALQALAGGGVVGGGVDGGPEHWAEHIEL